MPSSTLVSLFNRHQLILQGLAEFDNGEPYEIDPEYQHLMTGILQPGKTINLESMNAKIASCSFGLVGFCVFVPRLSFFCLSIDTFCPSCIFQAFEMMFKALDMNAEIDFARVCQSECPVTSVLKSFFGPDSDAAG